MRNLKKAVSLGLASIMLTSSMVVNTAAMSFTDVSDIVNTDAVTILSALGVMSGRDTGNFDPTAVVTRAEMASVLCRAMYGADVDVGNTVGLGSYTDTVGHWAEGFIGMATSEGWISGHGDGTFAPDDTVTTAQAALMVQRALGYYDSKDDTVDASNYIMDAIRLGNQLDLFDGFTAGATAGLCRDDVAAMTYNMMFNTMRVAYSTFTKVYYAKDVDSPSITSTNVTVEDDKTIAALVFDVVIEPNTDLLGRPVKDVVVDGETLASTSIDYTAIFVDATEKDDIIKKMEQTIEGGTNLLLNGTVVDEDKVFDGDDDSIVGMVIEVYDDYNVDGEKTDEDTTYVAYTYSYGEVSRVEYDEDDDETTIRISSKSYTMEGETSFEKDDMVMFTAAGTELESLTDTITVEGVVTGVASDYVRLDGEKYTYVGVDYLTSNNLGDTYALYVTPHGYVMGVEEIEDSGISSDYLFITDAMKSLSTVSAQAYFADGTSAVITVSHIEENGSYEKVTSISDDGTAVSGALVYDSDVMANSIFSYKLVDGAYKLTAVEGVQAADNAYISNNYIYTVDADGNKVSGFITFDDETLFVDVENGTVYVGYENVPDYTAFASGNLFAAQDDNVVFMVEGELDDSVAGTYVYLTSNDKYTTKVNDNVYHVYTEAYIDGELVKDGLYTDGLSLEENKLYEIEQDSNGYVTDATEVSFVLTADDETRTIGTSTIYTVDGNRYTYDEDSIFVLVDTIDDDISTGSASDLMAYDADEDEMTQLLVVSSDDGYIEVAYIFLTEKSI